MPDEFVKEGDPVFPIAAAANRALRTGGGKVPPPKRYPRRVCMYVIRSKPGFALAYRTGVNKGPSFWFALFLSLLGVSALFGTAYSILWYGRLKPPCNLRQNVVR